MSAAPPATARSLATRFGVVAAIASVTLFGVLRLPVVEQYVLLPLTRLQGTLAMASAGVTSVPVLITLSCSGADVIALCLAVTLSYPTPWPRRLAGAVVGVLLILAVNTVRIGTLALAASGPAFEPLHLYVWPGLLLLVTLAYVGLWTWVVDRPAAGSAGLLRQPAVVFGLMAALLIPAYVAAAPWLLGLGTVTAIAVGIAGIVARGLSVIGLDATAAGGVLTAGQSVFLVTPECVLTPLMPLYLAAAATLPPTLTRKIVGVLAFVPLFAVLTTARLLTVALPPLLGTSPLFVTHAFYQLLLAAVIVATVAVARRPGTDGARHAVGRAAGSGLLGVAMGKAGGMLAAAVVLSAVEGLRIIAPHGLTSLSPPGDFQGALAILPGFQIGFLIALWLVAIGRRRWSTLARMTVVLLAFQVGLVVALGELEVHTRLVPATALVRLLALLVPIGLVTAADWPRLRSALDRAWRAPAPGALEPHPGHG